RVRNRMKRPAQPARSNIKSSNVAGRRGKRFRIAATRNEEIFVDENRARQKNRLRFHWFSVEIFTKIDASSAAKTGDWLARHGIKRIHKVHYANENSRRLSVTPIRQAAIWLCANHRGIKFPQQFSRCRFQRNDPLRWRKAV